MREAILFVGVIGMFIYCAFLMKKLDDILKNYDIIEIQNRGNDEDESGKEIE